MNLFFDKLEAQWRQSLRDMVSASPTPTVDAQLRASLIQAFLIGRLQRYARSGFRRLPSENLEASLAIVLPASSA
jgi:TetR/AcrR family transcriptional regulator